jgi:hypothetical protein
MPARGGRGFDPLRLFQAVDRHDVDYLVVGGTAARAYGATRLTEDADCVVDRHDDNLERLAGALRELKARLRLAGMTRRPNSCPSSSTPAVWFRWVSRPG